MPVDIRISGDTAGEAVKELAALAAGLGNAAPTAVAAEPKETSVKTSRQRNTTAKPEKAEEDKPVQADPDAADLGPTDPDPAPEEGGEESVTVEQLRAKAAEVAQAGKQPNVKALLTEFGVGSISAVPEDQRAAFMKKLEKLANG